MGCSGATACACTTAPPRAHAHPPMCACMMPRRAGRHVQRPRLPGVPAEGPRGGAGGRGCAVLKALGTCSAHAAVPHAHAFCMCARRTGMSACQACGRASTMHTLTLCLPPPPPQSSWVWPSPTWSTHLSRCVCVRGGGGLRPPAAPGPAAQWVWHTCPARARPAPLGEAAPIPHTQHAHPPLPNPPHLTHPQAFITPLIAAILKGVAAPPPHTLTPHTFAPPGVHHAAHRGHLQGSVLPGPLLLGARCLCARGGGGISSRGEEHSLQQLRAATGRLYRHGRCCDPTPTPDTRLTRARLAPSRARS